jgi:lysophospholipase L1-like esterase
VVHCPEPFDVEAPVYRIAAALVLTALVSAPSISARQDAAPAERHPPAISFQDGDRILFIGDAFFEREYRFGLIETALTVAHADKQLTFRNLGWSGDNVWGEARALFGKPPDGYADLMKFVDLTKPTVVIVGYGANESFAGEAGLEDFLEQYRALLADLEARTPRIVLLTPVPADAATSPLPAADVDERNRTLARYSEGIASLARTRKLPVIDLFSAMRDAMTRGHGAPLFQNGVHLTEAGYAVAAQEIARQTTTAPVAGRFAATWLGKEAGGSPDRERWQAIRSLVVEKNDSFFHRWRPANVTYLYLFRQREQGKNVVEIPRFDPYVEQKEAEIAALRKQLERQP